MTPSLALPSALHARWRALPRLGWWGGRLRGLRRVRSLEQDVVTAWVGERPDGARELVRRGWGEAGVEQLLNELDALGALGAAGPGPGGAGGVVRPLWVGREGEAGLVVALPWVVERALEHPLDLRWLLRAFVAVARAVGALHRAGWVHAGLTEDALRWGPGPDDVAVWDLRWAQRPGPRRFEAFSARFAAPEQVTGGALGPQADVYALGVLLYSAFHRGRFPTILVPQGRAGAHATEAALSPVTVFGPGGEAWADEGEAAPDVQGTLGAKVLFATELERVVRRNTDIALAAEVLRVIERATELEPERRHADALALADALSALLARAEELAPA